MRKVGPNIRSPSALDFSLLKMNREIHESITVNSWIYFDYGKIQNRKTLYLLE